MDARARARLLVGELQRHGSAAGREGMARFGIDATHALGVRIPVLRRIARREGRDHALAQALWATGLHEARILASMVDEPERVTKAQMERWAKRFHSWDLCDQCCMNLFDQTPHAWALARAWAGREPEFVKRAGFALMASLAVHDKVSPDARFRPFFQLVEREAADPRNFVKKAVNWALRQIGKRSPGLRREAMAVAARLAARPEPAARWVGKDALRELSGRTRPANTCETPRARRARRSSNGPIRLQPSS